MALLLRNDLSILKTSDLVVLYISSIQFNDVYINDVYSTGE